MSAEIKDSERLTQLIELANQLVWKNPDLNLLRKHPVEEYPLLSQTLQTQLGKSEARARLFLPDLRALGNTSVAIFSDYSGESEGNYQVYSALVCAYGLTGTFNQQMKAIRSVHELGNKEIAFKDFGMGQIRRALREYLSALNHLVPGFLCTLAVDKRLTSLFGPEGQATRKRLSEMLKAENLGDRKAEVAEKLLRVVHLTAFLAALLAHDEQKILWVTDHDAICPNPELHSHALSLFQRVLEIYARPGCTYPILGGALPFAERSVEMTDLLSAADIVAGSIAQYLTKRDSMRHEDITVKQGADDVLGWLAQDGLALKKATFLLRLGKGGGIEAGTIEFQLVNPPADPLLVPILM